MSTVLVVEDEEHLRATLVYNLRKAGYDVHTAATGPEALSQFQRTAPDLVLLDVMLPGFDGFEVCRRIRRQSGIPILMLTARVDEIDTVVGLELGADDYIAKPFRMRELLARVSAAAPAANPWEPSESDGPPVRRSLPAICFSIQPRIPSGALSDPLMLKPRAFELLRFFMEHPHQVFTRDQLLHAAVGRSVHRRPTHGRCACALDPRADRGRPQPATTPPHYPPRRLSVRRISLCRPVFVACAGGSPVPMSC